MPSGGARGRTGMGGQVWGKRCMGSPGPLLLCYRKSSSVNVTSLGCLQVSGQGCSLTTSYGHVECCLRCKAMHAGHAMRLGC